MKPSHLLVAYDFSEPAGRALQIARNLRGALHLPVDVVHVHEIPLPVFVGGPLLMMPAPPMPPMRELIFERLKKVVDEAFGPEAAQIGVHCFEGAPAQGILDAAKSLGADCMVMGTTGRTGMSRLLMGSVAEKVVRLSTDPVLTTH